MQIRLALPNDLPAVRERLRAAVGPLPPAVRLDPLSQLIKSVLGARTYDEVAWAAFVRLRAAYPGWAGLMSAAPESLEPILDPVTFYDQKARVLPVLMSVIQINRGELDLDFLGRLPLNDAISWLLRLPGVGIKAAAAVLNLSRLNRRVMVVDAHVLRVACRLGLAPRGADADQAFEALMSQTPADWGPEDLFELHGLMKPHGQSICSHFEPACGLCPLSSLCPRVGVDAPSAQVIAFRRDA